MSRTVNAPTAGGWEAWAGWCTLNGETPMPATEEAIFNWYVDALDMDWEIPVMRATASAVVERHLAHGYADPTTLIAASLFGKSTSSEPVIRRLGL